MVFFVRFEVFLIFFFLRQHNQVAFTVFKKSSKTLLQLSMFK